MSGDDQNTQRCVVIGAGGALGAAIVRVLRNRGYAVTATYRTPNETYRQALVALGAETLRLNLEDESATSTLLATAENLIFVPILTVSERAAKFIKRNARAVFFSSNNVSVDFEAPVYEALRLSETILRETLPEAVILRPTMIYGHPDDKNFSRLIRLMRRAPLAPMPNIESALQQPVFFNDLANIAADALEGPPGRTIAVGGPEALTPRAVFQKARSAARAKTVFLPAPVAFASAFASISEKIGVKPPVSAAQIRRLRADKRPVGKDIQLGSTTLDAGLKALAAALDEAQSGA